MTSPSRNEPASPTKLNIEAIAKLEHEALERRTSTERVTDAIAKFIGTVAFLLLQVLLVLTWSAINLHVIPGVKAFDPYPFGILALVISSESVLLTIFVLISQNRMTRQADRRAHLDLQVGMLAEQADGHAPASAPDLSTPGHGRRIRKTGVESIQRRNRCQ